MSTKPTSEDIVRFIGAVFNKTHVFSVSDRDKTNQIYNKVNDYLKRLNIVIVEGKSSLTNHNK